jgi:hypothetical protein
VGASERWVVKLDIVGANPKEVPVDVTKTEALVSYFKGKTENWHTDLPPDSKLADCTARKNITRGNVIGFICAKDGTTPLMGAAVKFKNLTSGSMFSSSKTDGCGIFNLEGIESGIYPLVCPFCLFK